MTSKFENDVENNPIPRAHCDFSNFLRDSDLWLLRVRVFADDGTTGRAKGAFGPSAVVFAKGAKCAHIGR